MRLLIIAASLSGLILASSGSLAEEIYKWVDEDGITHYEAHPPKNKKNVVIKTRTGHSKPSNYSKGKVASSSDPVITKEPAEKDPVLCEKARKNLEIFNQYSRVRVTDENGEKRPLTPDEIATRKQNAERIVRENC